MKLANIKKNKLSILDKLPGLAFEVTKPSPVSIVIAVECNHT